MTYYLVFIYVLTISSYSSGFKLSKQERSEPQIFIQESFAEESFSFLISGDNGGFPEPFYSTKVQRNVAASMAKQSTMYDCKFILELGDNFYFYGVKDIYDRRWRGTFEEVYDYQSLYIPWYITTGNHDWMGNVQAQIEYSKISNRWNFPWYWYSLEHSLQPSGVKLRTIMFETTIPCGIGVDPDGTPVDEAMAEQEWAWLESELIAGQDADYLIVTGHYPVYSAGGSGPEIKCLKDRLEPLLTKYRVSTYISGHDHSAQVLIPSGGSPVKHIIIGCSNFVSPFLPNENSDSFSTEYAFGSWKELVTGCFARVDVSRDEMNIVIMEGSKSEEIKTVTFPTRNKI